MTTASPPRPDSLVLPEHTEHELMRQLGALLPLPATATVRAQLAHVLGALAELDPLTPAELAELAAEDAADQATADTRLLAVQGARAYSQGWAIALLPDPALAKLPAAARAVLTEHRALWRAQHLLRASHGDPELGSYLATQLLAGYVAGSTR